MEHFELIATYFQPLDAHNAKNVLEANDIFCQLLGEINATTYNFFTPSSGGIRLYVHENDVERALELLSADELPES